MEKELTDYVRRKYLPRAILLHGSRANGHARERSDWDFAILVDKLVVGEREIVFGANVEIKVILFPIEDTHALVPIFREENIKIIYDPDDLLSAIVREVTDRYKKGMAPDSDSVRRSHAAFLRVYINGMIDYRDEHTAFFRKLGELYLCAINYWFRFLHNEYMPQVYASLPRIQRDDPAFYRLLEILSSRATNQQKIAAAEELHNLLFR